MCGILAFCAVGRPFVLYAFECEKERERRLSCFPLSVFSEGTSVMYT